MSNQFVEQFKLYKSLVLNGYKVNVWLRVADAFVGIGTLMIISLVIWTQAIRLGVPFTIMSAILSIMLLINALISSEKGCGYFSSNGDKKNHLKKQLSEKIYTGSLYEIFDKNNPAVTALMVHNKDELKKELQNYRGIRGTTIIRLWELVLEREELILLVEKEKEDKRRKEEELEVITMLNTKTSKLIREIDEL